MTGYFTQVHSLLAVVTEINTREFDSCATNISMNGVCDTKRPQQSTYYNWQSSRTLLLSHEDRLHILYTLPGNNDSTPHDRQYHLPSFIATGMQCLAYYVLMYCWLPIPTHLSLKSQKAIPLLSLVIIMDKYLRSFILGSSVFIRNLLVIHGNTNIYLYSYTENWNFAVHFNCEASMDAKIDFDFHLGTRYRAVWTMVRLWTSFSWILPKPSTRFPI